MALSVILIDRLYSLENPGQSNILKISWGSELVFLTAILIGFYIHANTAPVSLNLFESVILNICWSYKYICIVSQSAW